VWAEQGKFGLSCRQRPLCFLGAGCKYNFEALKPETLKPETLKPKTLKPEALKPKTLQWRLNT